MGLDALVIIAFNQHLAVPAKTYEYLCSGKPILALCEEQSETYRVLLGHEGVVLVTQDDSHSIYEGLIALLCLVQTERKSYKRDISKLDYKNVFSPLFSKIESLLESAK
jgi:hypothetical protein